MSVSQQLLKNIFTSWAGFILRVVITFFFTPYITGVLGEARYGAWVIIFATLDYLSMADVGMKQALVRFISQALGERRIDKVNRTLNTAAGIYVVLALVVFSLALLVIYNLEHIIEIADPALLSETKTALFVISLQLTVFFLLMPFANTLGAFHRFDISNAQQMTAEVVRVVILVYLLSAGYGLVALVWAIFAVSLVRQAWAIITLRRLYPGIRFNVRDVDRSMVSKLVGYSKISFLITLMWLVIFRADAYILGGLVAVSAAGIYAPASQLFHYIRNLINAIGNPLVPAISHLETTDATGKLSMIYLKGVRYVSFVVALFATGCMFYAQDFVHLWLDPVFAPAGEVMMVLAIPAVIFLPQIVGNSVLFGIEQHRRLMYVLLVEAALKIVLGIVLVQRYGMIGLAWATAIPQAALYGFIYPLVMRKAIGVSVLRTYVTLGRSAVYAGGVAALVASVMKTFVPPVGWPEFFVNVAAVLLTAAPLGYALIEPDDRRRLRDLLRRDDTPPTETL